MRILPFVASVGIVLLAVAACGEPVPAGSDRAETDGESGRTASSRTLPEEPGRHSRTPNSGVAPAVEPEDRPGQARIQEGNPLPEQRIDGSALPENYPRTVNTTSEGTVLAIVAREGGCGRATAALVEQTSRRVTVLLGETKPQDERPCTMDIRHPTVTVSLAEPLGDRTVVLRFRER